MKNYSELLRSNFFGIDLFPQNNVIGWKIRENSEFLFFVKSSIIEHETKFHWGDFSFRLTAKMISTLKWM